ncbi:CoA pyrophosphatase [Chelatococcus sp. SYSU_G07232]|uniref:CoA pyrophosphatase n=1 Tax=Chelatococcus albus TaxID=3047466 RepID=A0ABT7AIX2_9HYPH|nr:CoA pyrophosphatase [Chelatococcus sp. SYSU_G07232]MDJ1159327.1 CoA pyrophosphatase [Chelatococcus sp. SYSU_G07232]
MNADVLDREGLVDRAVARLRREAPHIGAPDPRARGDHDLQTEPWPAPPDDRLTPAAVLVPIVAREPEVSILLTVRSAALRQHSAQIAFPGGKMDAGDASPLATALREAEEEIGLERRFVRPLGYLDTYLSRTGFRIVPIVGLVDPGFHLTLNRHEVDDTFEVPLGFLMDTANHQRHAREWQGTLRHYYAMPYGDRYIWGVTAGIIRNLYERLFGP